MNPSTCGACEDRGQVWHVGKSEWCACIACEMREQDEQRRKDMKRGWADPAGQCNDWLVTASDTNRREMFMQARQGSVYPTIVDESAAGRPIVHDGVSGLDLPVAETEGPLSAAQALAEARELVELTKAALAVAEGRVSTYRRWRRTDRRLQRWWYADTLWIMASGVILCVSLALWPMLVGALVVWGLLLSFMRRNDRETTTALGVASVNVMQAPSAEDERAEHEACRDYLWAIEGAVPIELICPAPDWDTIDHDACVAAAEEPYESPYVFDLVEVLKIVDPEPAYEAAVARVRGRRSTTPSTPKGSA